MSSSMDDDAPPDVLNSLQASGFPFQTAVAGLFFGVEAMRSSPRELLASVGVVLGATPWAIAGAAIVLAHL